ncbi:P-loop containing nucleoside triphosphate hydrolase protein, partial [Ochromonadaceae sp. CCMP2298]
AKRAVLPAYEHRLAVGSLLKEHQIVLISGETGCGKSTQVPQFLLDDETIGPTCRIAITQPRRLSAVAVAERIASERTEPIGATIGYNIRLDSQKSADTQVLFLTPGVLLRKLQLDPMLLEFSHVIVDEAHERDRFTEFLLIILRDICERRRDLKLILMSATMHTQKLRAYFGDIPQMNVGGSVYPVTEFFLEHALQFTGF